MESEEISASDWRFLGPTLCVAGHARCISNFYRLRINHVQEIGGFSFEPKPPTARAERLSYPKATIRLCLSEIKHAHTDDGVRQEMA
jgi:hypothetical protein